MNGGTVAEISALLSEAAREYPDFTAAWNGISGPIFLLALQNLGTIYNTLYTIPIIPSVTDMLDTTIYENMEVVFRRTYNFQNQVRNLQEMLETDLKEEDIKMDTIKRILELGRTMKEVIQQVAFNKEFMNTLQTSDELKRKWRLVTMMQNMITDGNNNFDHLAYLVKQRKRREYQNLKMIGKNMAKIAQLIKEAWQVNFNEYLQAKNVIK